MLDFICARSAMTWEPISARACTSPLKVRPCQVKRVEWMCVYMNEIMYGDCDVSKCFVCVTMPLCLGVCVCVHVCVSEPEGLLPCWLLCIRYCAPWWTVYLLSRQRLTSPPLNPLHSIYAQSGMRERPNQQSSATRMRITSHSFGLNITTNLDEQNK